MHTNNTNKNISDTSHEKTGQLSTLFKVHVLFVDLHGQSCLIENVKFAISDITVSVVTHV